MRTPKQLSLDEFLSAIGETVFDQPLIIKFDPRFEDVADAFQEIKRHGYGEQDTQYLKPSDLRPGDLVQSGSQLEHSLDSQSVVNISTGSWLSWPGMVTNFHRDWNLWSVLNFMLCGRKTWYAFECNHVTPHHANLVFADPDSMIRKIDAGGYGYKLEQTANECVYLPGGYYHYVVSDAFCLSFSMWWTWRERLWLHKSITDTWWLNVIKRGRFLKQEQARTVGAAYNGRPLLERLYCHHVYNRYLGVCDRLNAQRISDHFRDSGEAVERMKSLLSCATLEEARRRAGEI